jgi:predicted  nucleic acid-binding Zn-ribbon protein
MVQTRINSNGVFICPKRESVGDDMKIENLIVCILCLSFMANVVVAQDTNGTDLTNMSNITNTSDAAVNSAAIEARYDNVKYGYEKTLAAMDAVIGYLNNRTNTTELVGIEANFTSQFNGLQQYVDSNDASGFGKQVADMHKAAADFRSTTAKAAAPGEMKELKELVQNRSDAKENETGMKGLKANITEKKGKAYGLACQLNMDRINEFINNLKAQNLSAEDMQNVIMPLGQLCTSISHTGNETELNSRIDGIKDKLNEARTKIMAHAKKANEKAMDRAITVINALDNKGMNVSNVNEKLAAINAKKAAMDIACVNITTQEGMDACKDRINELKQGLNSIGEQIRVIAKNNSNLTRKQAPSETSKDKLD